MKIILGIMLIISMTIRLLLCLGMGIVAIIATPIIIGKQVVALRRQEREQHY